MYYHFTINIDDEITQPPKRRKRIQLPDSDSSDEEQQNLNETCRSSKKTVTSDLHEFRNNASNNSKNENIICDQVSNIVTLL